MYMGNSDFPRPGTRTYQKAAYWMLRYLGHAKAEDILALAAEEIQAKASEASRDASEVVVFISPP